MCPSILRVVMAGDVSTITFPFHAHRSCGAISLMNDHVVGSSKHHLCFSILVPIVCNDIQFGGVEAHHVRSHIYPPKAGAIKFVSLYGRKLRFV